MPVVLYHLGIRAARGGFVGVDIFFVISGFLISQRLIEDIEQDHFSILAFYERRIRRILPALIVVLAVTAGIYFAVSLPGEFVEFSKTLIAAATSVSNIYFWQHANYFAGTGLSTPLLHTWSLAVEEQFYIVWPVCLYLMHRHSRPHVVLITAMVTAASFLASAVGAFTHPTATFYLLHTRAWELSLGALLALNAVSVQMGPAARNALSIAGLALIAATILMVSSELPFPGLLALPPCLGAAMIILAGRDGPSLIGHLLSWRPVVFIGLISYSLYLWHWPITVMHRGGYLAVIHGQSARMQNLAVLGASLAVAALSWKFVEQPFRKGPWRPSRRTLMRLAAYGTAALVVVGIVGWGADGFPARYSHQELRIASYLNYHGRKFYRLDRCFIISPYGAPEFAPECLGLSATKRNFLVLGDSHAADLWYGLDAAYPDINFLQATAADCYPTLVHGLGERSYCTRLIDDVLHTFLAAHHVDGIVISARWTEDELPKLLETLTWLEQRGFPVTLFGPVPVYDGPLPRLIITGMRAGDPGSPDRHWDHSLRQLDAKLAKVAEKSNAQYVSVLDLLCPQSACLVMDGEGLPIYSDTEHFTAGGSTMLAQRLKDRGLWAPRRQ
jgi:peptidoglycan/LPS O-acetylase OafA/YrhL